MIPSLSGESSNAPGTPKIFLFSRSQRKPHVEDIRIVEMEQEKMSKVNEAPVVKVIELIGTSQKSWEEAAANAIKAAGETVRNITGMELKRCTATVEKSKIVEYRAVVKVAFDVER